MKRFKLQSGHVIKVDDCDAHIMRTVVWNGYLYNGSLTVCRGNSSYRQNFLSHFLAGEPGKRFVIHLNGDAADFTRANLRAMNDAEMAEHRRVQANAGVIGWKSPKHDPAAAGRKGAATRWGTAA